MTDKKISLPSLGIKSNGLPGVHDGIIDPLMGQAEITGEKRGPLELALDGRCYTPLGTDGYQRTKTVVKGPDNPTVLNTTDDTLVACPGIDLTLTSPIVGQRLFSVYQQSGGPLTFYIYADAGGTQLIYSQAAVPTATATVLTSSIPLIEFGTVYVKWSAAAGGTQYVVKQNYIGNKISSE